MLNVRFHIVRASALKVSRIETRDVDIRTLGKIIIQCVLFAEVDCFYTMSFQVFMLEPETIRRRVSLPLFIGPFMYNFDQIYKIRLTLDGVEIIFFIQNLFFQSMK